MIPRLAFSIAAAVGLSLLMTDSASTQRTLMASPTCEELTIMDYLARLDDPNRRHALDADQRRDVAQLKLEVCAPYVGYRVTRNPTTTWSNGRAITRNFRELNHPNGRIAKNRRDEWFYPSGPKAKSALGRWEYVNGLPARTAEGIWYTRDGKLVDDPKKARAEACAYLGKELCPFGKGDEDLLDVTMMGLINHVAPPSNRATPKQPDEGSSKPD